MNCQQGDLARIIDHPETRRLGVVDAFVRCHQLIGDIVSPGWLFEVPIIIGIDRVIGANDCLLRPLRDPGDDATDETLLYRHVKPPFMREPA